MIGNPSVSENLMIGNALNVEKNKHLSIKGGEMKSWYYAINSYYKTSSIHLEEGPRYLFILRYLAESVCDIVPEWKIPIIGRIKITRYGESTTINDYYGGFHSLFHCFIDIPIQNFCFYRIKKKWVELEWNTCKRIFSEDTELWETAEKEYIEHQEELEEEIYSFDRDTNPIAFSSNTIEVLKFGGDGKTYWYGREIESDDDFKLAMLEVRDLMIKANKIGE